MTHDPHNPRYAGAPVPEPQQAPRVAQIEADDGFVTIYQVGPGQRLPNRAGTFTPGRWVVSSEGEVSRLPLGKGTLKELDKTFERVGRGEDGAVLYRAGGRAA